MKNSALQRVVIPVCVLSICLMANYVMATKNPNDINNDYLTVRQSLIPMFAMGDFSGPYVDKQFPFNRINPKAREYIRFYLEEDNNSSMHITGAIWLLGFIGHEDDILFIDQYINKNLHSSPESFDNRLGYLRNIGSMSGCFAGMMIKRDIEGAESFLKKYARVSSWMVPGEKETPESLSNARDIYSHFIVCAYQYSKTDYIYPLLQEKLPGPRRYVHELSAYGPETIEVDKYTELMNQKTLSQEKLNENMTKCLERYGEWIDMLMRKQTYAQWSEENRKKKKTASRKEKRRIDSIGSFDMSETIEGRYLKSIGKEAAKAFGKVSSTLLDRSTKDLHIKKELLKEIRSVGLNKYDGFYVQIDTEAKVNDDVSAVTKEDESADVIFNIQGTADIYKKHASGEVNDSIALSTTGDVEINMKKTKNKWHWVPASDTKVIAGADIIEDNYLKTSVRDALNAYKKITKMLIDGDYDLMTIPVVDDGRLIPLEKRERQKDKMGEALDFEKKILKDIAKAKLINYGNYHVSVECEAILSNFAPAIEGDDVSDGINTNIGSERVVIKGRESTDVTFHVPEAAKILKKHISKNASYESIDGAGNLQVSMKRINGKWYWNPFGW